MEWLAVWPVPTLNQGGTLRKPVISDGFGSRNGKHRGVDIMFRRVAGDTQGIGDGEGSKRHVMPEGTLVLASHSGRVVKASWTRKGYRVRIRDAGAPDFETLVTHMSRLDVHVGQFVEAGTPLGVAGHSPDGSDPMHVHFAAYWRGAAIDPARLLGRARVVAPPAAWVDAARVVAVAAGVTVAGMLVKRWLEESR